MERQLARVARSRDGPCNLLSTAFVGTTRFIPANVSDLPVVKIILELPSHLNHSVYGAITSAGAGSGWIVELRLPEGNQGVTNVA